MLTSMQIPVVYAVVTMLICAATAQAQPTSVGRLKPGDWQVHSVVTPSMGSPVTSTVHVCAAKASDFWTRSRPGMSCNAPTTRVNGSAVHVELSCKGSAGPVTWTANTVVDEQFNAAADGFHATGKTITTTVMPGGNPIIASATMASDGRYMGSCAAH